MFYFHREINHCRRGNCQLVYHFHPYVILFFLLFHPYVVLFFLLFHLQNFRLCFQSLEFHKFTFDAQNSKMLQIISRWWRSEATFFNSFNREKNRSPVQLITFRHLENSQFKYQPFYGPNLLRAVSNAYFARMLIRSCA